MSQTSPESSRSPDFTTLPPVRGVRLGAYLRRLREGYGYTLRKVEERAQQVGEPIDNSQLSRFEKGKAIPSFEKLRALARIFNVSVQSFSDVLDLEAYESMRPATEDYQELLQLGALHAGRGDQGRAFIVFERAVEVAEALGAEAERAVADARWRLATTLKDMGKLTLAEQEFRTLLRSEPHRSEPAAVLLQLSHVYRALGDHCLATVMAGECLARARSAGDLKAEAAVLNLLANVHYDEERIEQALSFYRQALEAQERLGHDRNRAILLTNLGGCLVSLDRFEEGVAKIREAHRCGIERGYRRVAALAMTRLAEAYLEYDDAATARQYFAESDTLAADHYHDILFLNSFHLWQMATGEGNPTREKIAFGRLKRLRSLIERRFPEVERFDEYVESVRRNHG